MRSMTAHSKRLHGHTLSEYGLALALLVLLALGGLTLLGGNVKNLLSSDNSKMQNDSQKLYGLVGASSGGGGSGAGGGSTTLSFNPKTGQVTISGGAGGTGTNATSTDGVEKLLADKLGAMAQTTVNGKALPSDVQQDFAKLQQIGDQLADFQSWYQQNKSQLDGITAQIGPQIKAGTYAGQPVYSQTSIDKTVQYAANYIDFKTAYDSLNGKLSTLAAGSPEYAAMQQQVTGYAQMLSNMVDANAGQKIFGTFYMDGAPMSQVNAALAQNPSAQNAFVSSGLAALSQPDAVTRNNTFQTAILNIGQQNLVGGPITTATNMTIPGV